MPTASEPLRASPRLSALTTPKELTVDTGTNIKNRMPKGIKSRETPTLGAPLKASDLAYIESRAVSYEYALSEGWHRAGNRIGMPVRDAFGVVVNVRLHLPPPRADDAPKTLNTKGNGSPT